MKHILFFVIIFLSSSVFYGQDKNIELDWLNNQIVNEEGSYTEVPLASDVALDDAILGMFSFVLSWNSTSVSYEGGIISNVVYENIAESKLINIDRNKIPTELKYKVISAKGRGVKYESLVFTPIIKSSGVYKKVISFNLEYNNNNSLKSSNVSSKASTINEVFSSVLASGDWYKFKIDTTGVYKVTPQFLSSIGMDLSGVDPNTIKIYGNGGQSLPLLNSKNEIFDVPQNPIKIIGAEDGVFSDDDYILFYGRGVQKFVAENSSHVNPYSDDAYYYVTSGGNNSDRIGLIQESTEVVNEVFNSYDYYSFFERDVYNLGRLGRKWFGDKFDSFTNNRSYEFALPDLVEGSQLRIGVVSAAITSQSSQMSVIVSDVSGAKSTRTIPYSITNTERESYTDNIVSYNFQQGNDGEAISGNQLLINMSYLSGGDVSGEAYLDYVNVSAECQLKGINKQFGFSNANTALSSGVGQFIISNAENINSVWDVTDPYGIAEKQNTGLSNFSFNFLLGELRDYVVLDEDDFYSPSSVSGSRVANQDLKGSVFLNESNQFEDVDYLILANNDFLSAASELADFRSKNDGFNVKVVDVADIYNEFSTGKQDITAIRNFVKYIYDNASNEESRLKYICIIGDGSYDYKDRLEGNTNHVPMYHALESSSLTGSFSTDDFYCLMDETEGGALSLDKMDISVGRILARNLQEASSMVDKIKNYYGEEAFGDWRNSMLFLSDDVDVDEDLAIQVKIVEISDKLELQEERVNIKRILTDSYAQETTSGGERYSQARADFEQAFEIGTSYINYFGHGGEDGITGEFIFTAESAQNLTNEDRLPVFVTLTCELTRFDNPSRLTAGEFLYWNPIGGAVALVSTTRELFLSTGLSLNDSLSDLLFDENRLILPIGDVVRLMKNEVGGGNSRVVYCIGDPAIKIALPKPEVELTEVNGVSIDEWYTSGESLKALDKVELKGKVLDVTNNTDLVNYSGQVTVSVFDKDVERVTLDNDGVGSAINFTESGDLIFKGLATIEDGEFSSSFVLSKNIKLSEGGGKISFYVVNDQVSEDLSGAGDILIGGLNTEAEEDTTPPVIELFLNDEVFYSGQTVGASPSIFAKFSDENGINTAGGVGHDIVAVLDGDETNSIILNDYYSASLDDFTSGQLIYQLSNLEAGEHTLELRASDSYNNSSIAEITFIVGESSSFSLTNVLNYPNPFVSYTEFWFTHDGLSNDTLEVTVQVMTVTGKIVTTKFATLSGETTYRGGVEWNGRDDFGNKIGKGVYVYKITAKSTLTNKTTTKFEKLVVL